MRSALARVLEEARIAGGEQPFRYRFSAAGEPCLRALVYDAQDADDGTRQPEAPRRLRDVLAMKCGNVVGEHLETAAKRIGWITQRRHTFNTGAVQVSGSSDLLLPAVGVLDTKLVGEKSWARRPHAKHKLQANGYSVEADLPFAGLLYVRASTIFDAESPEVEVDLIVWPASVELAQELCGVWESVDMHRKLRTLPERIFDAGPKKFPCGWCRHKHRCLTNSPEEGADA